VSKNKDGRVLALIGEIGAICIGQQFFGHLRA